MSDTIADGHPDHDDSKSWYWHDKEESSWDIAPTIWQNFYRQWYANASPEPDAPYVLDLLPNNGDTGVMLGHTGNRLLVRGCYQELFKRTCDLAFSTRLSSVLVTGQSGAGKSMFLWYTLVSLLRRKYVVVFCTSARSYLFYFGKVYVFRGGEPIYFPYAKATASCRFIWTLLDIDETKEPPASLTRPIGYSVFPIQVSCPNPLRYRRWQKERWGGASWGLPLWNLEELIEGFKLQIHYTKFYEEFQRLTGGVAAATTPPGSSIFRESAKLAIESVRAAMIDSQDLTSENAIALVVKAAMDARGADARSVYQGVFFPDSQRNIDTMLWKPYDTLCLLMKEFWTTGALDSAQSEALLQITPRPCGKHDGFALDFKSPHIGHAVMKKMRETESDRIYELYLLFDSTAETSALAGWCFESIAHDALFAGKAARSPLRVMHPGPHNDPNVLSYTTVSLSSSTGPALFVPIPQKADTYDFSLQEYDLAANTYYRSQVHGSRHLFNAAFIDFLKIGENYVARVWVFKMTTLAASVSHAGTNDADGCVHLRKLISAAKRCGASTLLPTREYNDGGRTKRAKVDIAVQVEYVLVCPETEPASEREWRLARGWLENNPRDNHRGHVYCLALPLGP